MNSLHLGIDFGTTRSVVALADRGNFPVVNFTGHDGAVCEFYPSVIADNGEQLRFGFDALSVEGQQGWITHRSLKRTLSEAGGFDRSIELQSGTYLVVDLIAAFLKQLKRDLQENSSLPKGVDVSNARITLAVPANAHSCARLITLEAFRRAGFCVSAMLNEPSAAGIEYAHRYRSTITKKRENVLVYDLGGGTFDATIVRMAERKHSALMSRGLSKLGGDDFDDLLAKLALQSIGKEPAALSQAAYARLKNHCREQKEKVHANTRRILIELGEALPGDELEALGLDPDEVCIVSAKTYEAECLPLVDRTLEVVEMLLADWVKESGSNGMSEVAGVYVVGGASSLPVVARRLREVYGRRIHRSNYPSGAIAMGLAIAEDEAEGIDVSERFSRQFGVFRENMAGEEVAFDVIFDGSLVLPKGRRYETRRDYAPTHNIGHYRYVECGWLDKAGAPSGDVTSFTDIVFPFDPGLRGEQDLSAVAVQRHEQPKCHVEECYSVDEQGVVELTIRDVVAGYERSHRLSPNA